MNQSSPTPPVAPPEPGNTATDAEEIAGGTDTGKAGKRSRRVTGPRSSRRPRGRTTVPVGQATIQLPPVSSRVHHVGFRRSTSMRHSSRASPAQGALYRSVPPRPRSYTFSDMLEPPAKPGRRGRARSKTAPLASSSASEYAERFRSRPTTRPRVIHLDPTHSGVGAAGSSTSRGEVAVPRGMGGFFPPVKHRVSAHTRAKDLEGARRLPTARELQLAPLVLTSVSDVTPVLNGMSQLNTGTRSEGHQGAFEGSSYSPVLDASARRPIRTPETLPSVTRSLDVNALHNHEGSDDVLEYAALLNGSSDDYDDLTNLPRPKRIFPRKELPWVYRFKVKKGMNELSKIMASKPLQTAGEADPAEGT